MKSDKVLLLLATGLCAANHSLAQTADCSPDKERTAVYFVNGMFTDESDAQKNLLSLRGLAKVALQNTVGPDGSVIFQNAYNENEPAWEQLVQVYAQKAGDDLSMFWRMMAGNASLTTQRNNWHDFRRHSGAWLSDGVHGGARFTQSNPLERTNGRTAFGASSQTSHRPRSHVSSIDH